MRTTSRFERDRVVVSRTDGSRDSDGFTEGSTTTVLQADGDAQSLRRMQGDAPVALESGGLVFYATKDVSSCSTGDDATVTLEDGTVLDCTVERVRYDDSSLELSTDG